MKIGFMVWRIGECLDFFEQVEWTRQNRFQEISFWSFPGQTGRWQGFDLISASPEEMARLRAALRDFEDVDIHAPCAPWRGLDTDLGSPNPVERRKALSELDRLLTRSAECEGKVVTLHPPPPRSLQSPYFLDCLTEMNDLARKVGVRIGMELTSDYDLVSSPSLTHVGLTVDVGHMQFGNAAGYRAYGRLGGLIERFGAKVFHVHIHDYDGVRDHLAIGHGRIDFGEILRALHRIEYNGSLCLELNPDVVTPDEILESRTALAQMITEL